MEHLSKKYNVGDDIDGYTYFIGDFHDTEWGFHGKVDPKYLGMPKLRPGIILIEKHPYYMVSFACSSAASGFLPDDSKINIKFYRDGEVNSQEIFRSREWYCIWVTASEIETVFGNVIIDNINEVLEEIASKQGREKKRVGRLIMNGLINNYKIEKRKYLLQRGQFSSWEIKHWMTDEKVACKIKLLFEHLDYYSISNEEDQVIIKRIFEANDWINDKTVLDPQLEQRINELKKEVRNE